MVVVESVVVVELMAVNLSSSHIMAFIMRAHTTLEQLVLAGAASLDRAGLARRHCLVELVVVAGQSARGTRKKIMLYTKYWTLDL
jgi:hypothetical protein